MAGYIRQDVTNNIADGNVINASDFDNEYNAIEAAFHASTGHTHDGTSAEGAPITKMGPAQDLVVGIAAVTPKTDNTLDLGSSTLEFKDLYIDGTANIDSLVADTADINAGTIDGVTIGGASAGAGTFTTVAATTGNITTVNATTVDTTNIEVTNIKAKDGTASVTLADSTGVATFSANPILNAGTANGVSYLNASKVLTTGSALTFDGTNLGVPTLNVSGTGNFAANVYLTTNATYYHSKTSGGTNIRMLGINAGNVAYVGPIDSGPTDTIFGASSSLTNQAWYVGGSEQMRLTSTGLGIGTSSPGNKLDVNGVIRARGDIFAMSSGDRIQLLPQSAGNGGIIATADSTFSAYSPMTLDASYHVFRPNGTEAMRLTSTGLGIGTSVPGLKLDVAGGGNAVRVRTDGSAIGRLQFTDSGATTDYAYIGTPAANTLAFWTNGLTERMRLDSSGNLGIGTSSPSYKLVVSNGGASGIEFGPGFSGTSNLIQSYNRSGAAYVNTVYDAAEHRFNISGSERMRLDSSGNLLVGLSGGANGRISVLAPASGASAYASLDTANSGTAYAELKSTGTTYGYIGSGAALVSTGAATQLALRSESSLLFSVGTTERARIDSSGNLLVGTTGQIAGSTSRLVAQYSSADYVARFDNSNATPFGLYVSYASAAPNGTGNVFMACADNATTRLTIRSNGGIANYQANDVNLSDRREKTNFAPSKSYLDTICAIPVQTFNYIDQSPDDPGLTLGVVAQDVQAVAPELVMESNWGTADDPKMRLSIYQTDLQYALMKCVQELKAQNDELRARVAALEAQP